MCVPDRRRWPWQTLQTTLTPPAGLCNEHWEREGHTSGQLNSINVIKFRRYMLTPTLTLSGACLASPRPLSLHRFPSRSLFATPRPTPPTSRSKDWPYLHPEWTSNVKSMHLRRQSSESFKSYWFWMHALCVLTSVEEELNEILLV